MRRGDCGTYVAPCEPREYDRDDTEPKLGAVMESCDTYAVVLLLFDGEIVP